MCDQEENDSICGTVFIFVCFAFEFHKWSSRPTLGSVLKDHSWRWLEINSGLARCKASTLLHYTISIVPSIRSYCIGDNSPCFVSGPSEQCSKAMPCSGLRDLS